MVYLVFLWILNVIGLRGCIIADFFFSWEEGGGGERTPLPGMLSGMRSCWTDAGKACAGGCPGSEVQGVRIEWRGGSSV